LTLPALPRHEVLDLELRQRAREIEVDFLRFCDLAAELIADGHYTCFGYADPADYFEQRLGISYRSLRRRLTVVEALASLPEAVQDEAREALAELGSHKAAVLAPMLKAKPETWRAWVQRAAESTVEAIQERVSQALGLRPRGKPDAPGERWYRRLLHDVPPDAREEVEAVFAAGARLAETTNPLGVFLHMVREVAVEWQQRAR